MNASNLDNVPVAYTTGWNHRLRKPLLGEVWLTEDEARDRFEVEHSYFQVLEGVARNGEPPSFILEIRSSETGRLSSHRYNPAGSVIVVADLRPDGDRYFVDQVTSWTYPDEETRYGMSGSTSITTVTFEPDGTGTLTLRDKVDPSNDVRMEARDIPVAEHWIERFTFGQWNVLRDLPALKPTRPLVPPRA